MEEEAEKLKQLQTEVEKQLNLGSPTGLSMSAVTQCILTHMLEKIKFNYL